MTKKALITGITGQDGAYLAKFLLEKGYVVHGLKRRCSSGNTLRLGILGIEDQIQLHESDLTDTGNLLYCLNEIRPDEVYNLGAQSHVQTSFMIPEHTLDINGFGVLRLLESIRQLGLGKQTKFYQASTSELYGIVQETPQTEKTPFYPRSPYGIAKLCGYWATVNFREAYGLFSCNGILFNHESPLRGEEFVTKKIVKAAVGIHRNRQNKLLLGNLDAQRDWGYAPDYVEGMWKILQNETPSDYILATGVTTTVREFTQWAFEEVGIILRWEGTGADEKGIDDATGKTVVEIDPQLYRPTEVDTLLGDAAKAHRVLNWYPKHTLREIISIMVRHESAQ